MPKLVDVKKIKTYLGTTYCFYVGGVYMGAAPTRARGLRAAKDALERWDFKTMRRKRPRGTQ